MTQLSPFRYLVNMEKLYYKLANLVLKNENMALDVYSGGLAIEPLRESMGKLSYGDGVDKNVSLIFNFI